MSDELYARLGRLQESQDKLNAEYDRLLTTFAAVVSGEIDRRRVLVNLSARAWEVAKPGEQPAMPCTINGEPRCVVYQERGEDEKTPDGYEAAHAAKMKAKNLPEHWEKPEPGQE